MSGNTQPHSLPFLPKQPQPQPQAQLLQQQQQQQHQAPRQAQSQAQSQSQSQLPLTSPDAHLPQGECTFLKPQSGRSPLRCDCVAFTLDRDKPGSICGCGHQAWTHVRTHVGEGVSREEFAQMVHQVKELRLVAKQMHDELNRQREQHEKDNTQIVDEFRKLFDTIAKVKAVNEHRIATAQASLEQRLTQVASLTTHLEDRIEAVVDKTQNWDQIVEKINLLDEASMRLEESIDADGPPRGPLPTRKIPILSPVHEASSAAGSPMPLDRQATGTPAHALPWTVKVVLLPRKMSYAFTMDSVAWRRSYSRGLHQEVTADTRSAEDFVRAVNATFKVILQNRPWVPLVCLRSEDRQLSALPLGQDQPHLWDYAFLEKHCFAHDKLDGDVVYIAPTSASDELSWSLIRALPAVAGGDESSWDHNNELDGFPSLNFSRPQTRPSQTPGRSPAAKNTLPPISAIVRNDYDPSGMFRKSSIETDSSSLYDNSPPPYTTRTYSPAGMDGQIIDSRLNILAITALERGRSGSPAQSANPPAGLHAFDPRASLPRPNTSAGLGERPMTGPQSMPPPHPLHHTGNEMELDDNADSRSERSGFDSASLSRSASGSTSRSAPAPAPPPQQYYLSGRSKRKIATGKYKEPVGLNISDVKLPRLGFHKHSNSDEKGKGNPNSSGNSTGAV